MSESSSNWRGKTCAILSFAILAGFLVFFAATVGEEVSKQAVYVGKIGLWLGVYLLFALFSSVLCVALLLWMFFKRDGRWKRSGAVFLGAWALTLLSYWAWQTWVDSQRAGLTPWQ